MKRILLLLTIPIALSISAREWTLDECIDYAIENNLTIKAQEISLMEAEQQLTAAKDAVLPQVSGQVSNSWNFGRGLTSSNTYANSNTMNFGANIGLQLPLFNGLQTIRQIDYAKASLTAIVETVEATKDDVTLRIIAQYLQTLYCRELESVALSQLNITEEELERRKALLEAGKIPEADMLDAGSQVAQARLQWVTAQNDTRLALLDLSQLLRLPASEDFAIANLNGEQLPTLREPNAVYEAALSNNHTINANRLQIHAAERNIKVAQTGWIPRLSFNAGLGTNYYKISNFDNNQFKDQMRENFSQYVGFSLSVPIFDGFSTRNNVRRAELQRLNANLNLETQMDNLYKAINESYFQAVGARERLTAAIEATTAAEAALAAVREKYNLGRATATDFDNAKEQLLQSQSERARALYELLLRARILDFYAEGRK